MSYSRKKFIDLLKEQLEPYPAKKQSILDASQNFWKTRLLASRALDPFQKLSLSDPEFFAQIQAQLHLLFEKLDQYYRLRFSSEMTETDDLTSRINAMVKYANQANSKSLSVESWVQSIIEYVCPLLLEKNGSLDKELVQYLNWDNAQCYFRNGIEDIVCSYTAILIQSHFFELILEKNINITDPPYTAMQKIIGSYGNWVRKKLSKEYSRDANFEAEKIASEFTEELLAKAGYFTYTDIENIFTTALSPSKEDKFKKFHFSVWLEVSTQVAECQKAFLPIWNVFVLNFKKHMKIEDLTQYELDQFLFCHRRILKLDYSEKNIVNYQNVLSFIEQKRFKESRLLNILSEQSQSIPENKAEYEKKIQEVKLPTIDASKKFTGDLAVQKEIKPEKQITTIEIKPVKKKKLGMRKKTEWVDEWFVVAPPPENINVEKLEEKDGYLIVPRFKASQEMMSVASGKFSFFNRLSSAATEIFDDVVSMVQSRSS